MGKGARECVLGPRMAAEGCLSGYKGALGRSVVCGLASKQGYMYVS